MCTLNCLSCFKAMSVEYTDEYLSIYRTSRVSTVLGGLFALAGVGILIHMLLQGKCASSMFALCILGLFVALGFILAGIVLISHHKIVKVYKNNSKIEVIDSSITGYSRSSIHFSDISGVEVSEDSDMVLGEPSGLWVVRLYLSKIGKNGLRQFIKSEKIFATDRKDEALVVRDYFAHIENVVIVNYSNVSNKFSLSAY